MQISTWKDNGFDLSAEEIESLFAPFVAGQPGASKEQWHAAVNKRKRVIRKGYFKRFIGYRSKKRHRDTEAILKEYATAWQPEQYRHYTLDGELTRLSPWEYRGRELLASDIGATRVRQLMLVRIIEQLKPRRVLEVGCGNGINLLMLAGRFPDIQFSGLELTREGHEAAIGFQQQEDLPASLQAFVPLPLSDTTAFRRIHFHQGTAAELPFSDNEFDLVYSVLALEQMESIRHQALGEFARVTAQHALMIEPFYDVNSHGWPKANVTLKRYFQGKVDELPRYGLNPLFAINDFPQETFLKVCAVLSRKEGAAPPAG